MAYSILAEKITAELYLQGLIKVSDIKAVKAVVDTTHTAMENEDDQA